MTSTLTSSARRSAKSRTASSALPRCWPSAPARDYIAKFDSLANAEHVLDALMRVVQGLVQFPERGSYPEELVALGIKDYRQTAFKPYRVIYRVLRDQVFIYLIVDGRRDTQSVLARRLLGA